MFTNSHELPAGVQYEAFEGRIDEDVKALWIEGLLDGSRQQAKYTLHKVDGGFCCLGVYCDVTGVPFLIEVADVQDENPGNTIPTDVYAYGVEPWGRSTGVIPTGYGLKLYHEKYDDGYRVLHGGEALFQAMNQELKGEPGYLEAHSLTELNDEGLTFAQIADVINYFL